MSELPDARSRSGRWMLILAACFVLAHGYLALASPHVFLRWFSYDDAFYYFKTAQNIVTGRGVTFDGTGPTNGFQPLWMLLLLPVYALTNSDGLLALRGIILLDALLLALAAWLLFTEGQHTLGVAGAWLSAGLLLFVPPLYLRFTAGGMESALSVLTLILFWAAQAAAYRTAQTQRLRQVALVGIAAALAMLARLDNALVVGVVGLLWWYRWAQAKVPWRRQWPLALAFGGPGAVSVSAFLLWSRLVVGTWLPVSSQVKMWWGSLVDTPYPRALRYRILRTLDRLLDPAARAQVAPRTLRLLWASGGALGGGALLVYALRRFLRRVWDWLHQRALEGMVAGALVHFGYMQVLSGLSPLRAWYWTSERVALLLVIGAAVGALWRSPKATIAAPALVALAGLGFSLWLVHTFPPQPQEPHPYLGLAVCLEAYTEPGAVIGATGAGALGYFVRGRRVLNLDGLIAPPAYLRALQHGEGVAYLQHQGLRYVFGAFWLTKLAPYRDVFAHRLQPVAKCRYEAKETTLYLFLP